MKSGLFVILSASLFALAGCGGKSSQDEHNKNLTPVTAKGGLKPTSAGGAGGGAAGKTSGNSAPKAATPP